MATLIEVRGGVAEGGCEPVGVLGPLPPPGPVTIHVLWDQRGIPETATEVDLTTLVTSAAEATILWPLPDPPDEPRWLLRAPLTSSSGFSSLSIGPEAQSTELGQGPQ